MSKHTIKQARLLPPSAGGLEQDLGAKYINFHILYICIYICMYIHVYIYVYTYIYIHI